MMCWRRQIDAGEVDFADLHPLHAPRFVEFGMAGTTDRAIVQATAVTTRRRASCGDAGCRLAFDAAGHDHDDADEQTHC